VNGPIRHQFQLLQCVRVVGGFETIAGSYKRFCTLPWVRPFSETRKPEPSLEEWNQSLISQAIELLDEQNDE
jgi:hypothetical protein